MNDQNQNPVNEEKNPSGVTAESPRPALECCVDWKPQTEKLNAPIVLAQARNPYLTNTPAFQFKPWQFCPWCGRNRAELERYVTSKIHEAKSKGLV
jgi:hypothetical protein